MPEVKQAGSSSQGAVDPVVAWSIDRPPFERRDDGTRLLRKIGDEAITIFETDHHLASIRPSVWRTLPLAPRLGLDTLVHCLLPPGYQDGRRLAAVVWVYPVRRGPRFPHYERINDPSVFNLHLLAARGFAVICPSVLTDETSRAGRELIDCLTEPVQIAVAAVVEAGLVDPAHLHVLGHSLGGWAALALLANTKLFRTGIAMAAASNLVSSHGETDLRQRYDRTTSDHLSEICERTYFLPGPPWKHLDRYIHDSPYYVVERISAPVLLIQGDQDYVSIAQSEAMFRALRQANKDAEFVRYWGEGHVFQSPANIRDAWNRIFAWLEGSTEGRDGVDVDRT